MTRDGERAIELINELGSRVGDLLSDQIHFSPSSVNSGGPGWGAVSWLTGAS